MAKMSESQLTKALRPFNAILKGWSTATKDELDVKVEQAWAEIDRLKATGGPWKKAKSDVAPMMKRWQSLGGLATDQQRAA